MSAATPAQRNHKHGAVTRDPVCGMTVDPHKTQHRAEHAGHPYYFCSAGCRTKFVAGLRGVAFADYRRSSHGAFVGERDREFLAVAGDETVNIAPSALRR